MTAALAWILARPAALIGVVGGGLLLALVVYHSLAVGAAEKRGVQTERQAQAEAAREIEAEVQDNDAALAGRGDSWAERVLDAADAVRLMARRAATDAMDGGAGRTDPASAGGAMPAGAGSGDPDTMRAVNGADPPTDQKPLRHRDGEGREPAGRMWPGLLALSGFGVLAWLIWRRTGGRNGAGPLDRGGGAENRGARKLARLNGSGGGRARMERGAEAAPGRWGLPGGGGGGYVGRAGRLCAGAALYALKGAMILLLVVCGALMAIGWSKNRIHRVDCVVSQGGTWRHAPGEGRVYIKLVGRKLDPDCEFRGPVVASVDGAQPVPVHFEGAVKSRDSGDYETGEGWFVSPAAPRTVSIIVRHVYQPTKRTKLGEIAFEPGGAGAVHLAAR